MPQNAASNSAKAEELQLLPLASGGDDEALGELIRRFEPLIAESARQYEAAGLDADDLRQEGRLGLVAAVQKYREGRGASFRTFAGLCIKRQMVSAVRRAGSGKNTPLHDYIPLDGVNEPQLGAEGPTPEEIVISMEYASDLRSAVEKRLTPEERRLFSLYLSGLSYENMAARLHMPKKQVDNSLQRIKRKLGMLAG